MLAECKSLTLRSVLAALCLLALASTLEAQSDAFKVIVHPDNPVSTLNKREASGFFLKKTTQWADKRDVRPIDLSTDSETREAFTREIHRRSVSAVKNFWAQSIFAGRAGPPAEVASDAEVVAFVTANRGAIGYVSADVDSGGAKIVEISD